MKEVKQTNLTFMEKIIMGVTGFLEGWIFLCRRLIVTCVVDAAVAAVVYECWIAVLSHHGIKLPFTFGDIWLILYSLDLITSCLR